MKMYPKKNKNKYFFSLLILVFICFFCACQSSQNSESISQKNQSNIIENIFQPTKNTPPTLWNYPQKDSVGYVFYLKKRYNAKNIAPIKAKELEKWSKELEKKYNISFKTHTYQKYFNIAYRCTDAQRNHLEYVSKVFFKDTYQKYFKYEPKNPFQIVYFANKDEFVKYTKSSAYGFYQPSTKTLFTYTGSGEGTLWHELMHAFVDTNIEHNIQQWFSEGLASFYEMGGISNDIFLEGYTNWRQPLLIKMLGKKNNLPLDIFLEEEEMSEDDAYAKARFLFCYLWINNKMISFVNAYLYELSAQYKGKELTKKTIDKIEKLLGKNLKTIEKEYNELAKKFIPYQKLQQIKN